MTTTATADGSFARGITQPADFSKGILNLFSLKGRTAIITGAGQGIGLAVAHAFAEAGANVAITYRTNTDAGERAKEIAEKYGVKCTLTFWFTITTTFLSLEDLLLTA